MEHVILGNLDLWSKYVRKGFDIVPSFPALRVALSTEIIENADGVRSFISICNENNISTVDLFGKDEGLRIPQRYGGFRRYFSMGVKTIPRICGILYQTVWTPY